MHQRLANEFLLCLSRRALAIIAPCLPEEDKRGAFSEFHAAFKEELLRYEQDRERMQARLRARPSAARLPDEDAAIPHQGDAIPRDVLNPGPEGTR
jgi:hypothetical protein